MKKLILSAFFLIFCVFGGTVVKAYNLVDLEKQDGSGYVTYRGTNIRVQIPDSYRTPETDFRGVWISTMTADVASYSNKAQYIAEMESVFAVMEYYNLNAMLFHVRIYNDALYNSSLNKISPYYQGVNFAVWDPLEWLINECHRRGIEFHAWMNPYRVKTSGGGNLSEYAKTEPSYNIASDPKNLLNAGGSIILNPGEPDVRDFLVRTCLEVAEKYDVDAIHFDDYFYAAGIDDADTRAKYNSEGLSADNFRRRQVDLFIEQLSEALHKFNNNHNRVVQLGISPTGIYRNGVYSETYQYDEDGNLVTPVGSNTAGYSHYDAPLYADTKKWIENDWIDYILPQVYWTFERDVAGYAAIMDWWDLVIRNQNVNLYSGMGFYRMLEGESPTSDWRYMTNEPLNEAKYGIKLDGARGHCIYTYKNVKSAYQGGVDNPFAIALEKLKDEAWCYKAVMPEIRTYDQVVLPAVKNLCLGTAGDKNTLVFDGDSAAKFYVIYRSSGQLTFAPEEVYDIIDGSVSGNVYYEDDDNGAYFYGVRPLSVTNTLGAGSIAVSGDFYYVTFRDDNGEVFNVAAVLPGGSVTPPAVTRTGYNLVGWSEDLSVVNSDLDVYPIFEIKKYKVVFVVDGSEYDIIYVPYNTEATTDAPEKEGHIFSHWDKNIDHVTSDMVVNAVFSRKSYVVTFLDYDGSVLREMNVLYGQDANPPFILNAHFYTWEPNYHYITGDLTVRAIYDVVYTITFYVNDDVYETKLYVPGTALDVPAIPSLDGYDETPPVWSVTDFDSITEDIDVYPVYTKNIYAVIFIGYNNKLLKTEYVEYGNAATAPDVGAPAGYAFESWDKDYSFITKETTVNAIFKEISSSSCRKGNIVGGISLLTAVLYIILRRRY